MYHGSKMSVLLSTRHQCGDDFLQEPQGFDVSDVLHHPAVFKDSFSRAGFEF